MQKCSSEDGEEFSLTEISTPQIIFLSKRNLSHGNKNSSKTDNGVKVPEFQFFLILKQVPCEVESPHA